MKIYTRKGDEGETSLIGGIRVKKDHIRLHAYGTVDELNSHIGLVSDGIEDQAIRKALAFIQDRLFVLGSQLAATPESKMDLPDLETSDTQKLETAIDAMEKQLEPLRNFILPGGHPVVSQIHISRTVCRRAERWSVTVMELEKSDPSISMYLNRLSDYLFVLARYMANQLNVSEISWNPRKH